MRKLRARMADMGTACYVCAWPVLKRRVGDLALCGQMRTLRSNCRCDVGASLNHGRLCTAVHNLRAQATTAIRHEWFSCLFRRGHHLLRCCAVGCFAGRGRAMLGGLPGVAADPAEVLDGVAGDPVAGDLASVLIPGKSAVPIARRTSGGCRAPCALRACGIGPDGRGGHGQRQRGVVVAHAGGMAFCSRYRRQPGPQRAQRTTGGASPVLAGWAEKDRGGHPLSPWPPPGQIPDQGCARGGACRHDLG
jgi:hypothetical protein